MKKLRSQLNHCLLCGEGSTCDGDNEEEISTVKLEGIVGGVNCVLLERQLEKMFILLNILDVPKNWCEETLQSFGGDGGGDNPDKWFILCDKCTEGNVGRAWRAYQNILKWQTRMLAVKLEILEGMRRSILKNKRGNKRRRFLEEENGGKRSQVDLEIKRYLFPDLFTKLEVAVKQEIVEEDPCSRTRRQRRRPQKYEDSIDDKEGEDNHGDIIDKPDDDSDYQPDNLPEHVYDDKMDEEDKIEDKPKISPPRRRRPGDPPRPRGRPPKKSKTLLRINKVKKGRARLPDHLRKPSFRHPYNYYDQYGVLRQKSFHWKNCPECPVRYAYQEDFEAHLELHEKRKLGQRLSKELDCTKCLFLARDPQELEMHLKRKHKEDKAPPKYFQCPKCPFKTLRWKVVKWHCLKEHPEVPLKDYGALFDLKCKVCGRVFQSLQQFTMHGNRMHPKEGGEEGGPVQCAECGVRFLNKALLGFHEKREHREKGGFGVMRYQCDECGMAFDFPGRLRRHKRNKHGGPLREHVCEICGMDFGARRTYDRHFERFHKKMIDGASEDGGGGEGPLEGGGKGNLFKCKYCEVTSGLRAFIKRHVQEEHKGEMRWSCDLCERRYTKKQGLEMHKKLNHGGRRWYCEWCGKGFGNEQYMRDHQKKYCRLIGVGKGEMAGNLNEGQKLEILTGREEAGNLNGEEENLKGKEAGNLNEESGILKGEGGESAGKFEAGEFLIFDVKNVN